MVDMVCMGREEYYSQCMIQFCNVPLKLHRCCIGMITKWGREEYYSQCMIQFCNVPLKIHRGCVGMITRPQHGVWRYNSMIITELYLKNKKEAGLVL
jgi:hypothetical protein